MKPKTLLLIALTIIVVAAVAMVYRTLGSTSGGAGTY